MSYIIESAMLLGRRSMTYSTLHIMFSEAGAAEVMAKSGPLVSTVLLMASIVWLYILWTSVSFSVGLYFKRSCIMFKYSNFWQALCLFVELSFGVKQGDIQILTTVLIALFPRCVWRCISCFLISTGLCYFLVSSMTALRSPLLSHCRILRFVWVFLW